MEAGYKDKFWLKIRDPRLALIFLGFLMIIIVAFLPPDIDENIKRGLMLLGFGLILIGVCIITLPYIKKEMSR